MEKHQKNEPETEMGTDPKVDTQNSPARSHLIKPGQVLNPKGKPVGTQNRLTKTFKQAAEEAFTQYKNDSKGIKGGVQWLQSLMDGTASDRAAVLGLYGRLIPHQMVGKVDHAIKVQLSWLGGRTIGKTVLDMQSPEHPAKLSQNQDVTDVDMRQAQENEPLNGGRVQGEEGSDHDKV